MSDADFKQIAIDAGVPTTEVEINAHFNTLRSEAGLVITNADAFGPLWRFISAVATTPVKWLVELLVVSVLKQAFLKHATGPFLVLHAWAVNITPKDAVAAQGALSFTRIDTAGALLIPAGSVVTSIPINGAVYTVTTTSDATIADGDATLSIAVLADSTGEGFNLATGFYTVMPDDIAGIDSVTNAADWLTVLGADNETDDDLRNRTRLQFTAINQWHTDAVYKQILASIEGITTDNIYFTHDAPRGEGSANAYVMVETGDVSGAIIASLQSEITDKEQHGHGDDVRVFAMPTTDHVIAADIWFVASASAPEKTQALIDIALFVRCAFRENTDYSATKPRPFTPFYLSTLADEIKTQFSGVENAAFNIPVIVNGLALPRIDTLAVTEYA